MTICATCGDPIVKTGATRSGLATWDHDGEPADHPAVPQPTCLTCGSADYRYYETAWGYGWRCPDGHTEYYSLGD